MAHIMPPFIAGTYKVIGEIGSGGGGIVYLAEHVRLEKKVVLKADKRTLSTKSEVLRREVDALKDLSHTVIPQVYDFIEEDGIVYTIMDYIDGESLDKPLKRGERFTPAQVVEWACQLLDALVYLHSRPPHGILHADIKPANIMLTPRGDVRLIDFNIALALGEEGAVSVGRSFGYASPEHYGLDYASGNVTRGIMTDVVTDISDDTASDVATVLETKPSASSSSSATGSKAIMLDVRSDIYSLGATLYHMMTGQRPAQKAIDVAPISSKEYSTAVTAIIAKSMHPDPNARYQSAQEMLHAFTHLRENDPRTKRHKRITVTTTAVLILSFLVGAFTTFVGLKQMEQRQNAYVLAEYSGNALRAGDVVSALDYALQALPLSRSIFTPPNTAEAQKALTDALRVYDLSDGFQAHRTVELPSNPLYMTISPNGKTAAVVYAYAVAVIDTDTAAIVAKLPTVPSALAEVHYIDADTLVYAGEEGLTCYDIATGTVLWSGKPATALAVSADGTTVAAVYKEETFATIYDVASGRILREIHFGGKQQRVTVNDRFANPHDNLLALNHDGTLLGVSFADGSLSVYDLKDSSDGEVVLLDGTEGYTHLEGGFYERYFAFSATHASASVFAVIDTVEWAQTGGFESARPFGVQADASGIYVQTDNVLVNIHPLTGEQTPLVTTAETIVRFARGEAHTLITSKEELLFFDTDARLIARHEKEHGSDFIQIAAGTALIGSLDAPSIRMMTYINHREAEVFAYDPSYTHDEARLSADGETVMLYSYDHFRLYDRGGNLIIGMSIPDATHVYDQQFRRNERGSYLEVVYDDGTIRAYAATDGRLLYETMGEVPDLTLHEEFFTDTLRIVSPLHGVPIAYDRKTGKRIRELEKDAYLTYVTQVGRYVITEYVTAEGERYGLLLNERCETLAVLPFLTDIIGETLVFDYPTGNLRQSRIYDLHELIELAEQQIYR